MFMKFGKNMIDSENVKTASKTGQSTITIVTNDGETLIHTFGYMSEASEFLDSLIAAKNQSQSDESPREASADMRELIAAVHSLRHAVEDLTYQVRKL